MMGLAPSELYSLELVEFNAAYEGWLRLRRETMRDNWERTRWSTVRLAALQMTSTANIMELFPLPWDDECRATASAEEEMTIEERRRRVEEIMRMKQRANE